jgi:NAD+ synthase
MRNSWSLIKKHLISFLQDEVAVTGLKNVTLGLSGGLDSAVVAVLLKEAFADNMLAVMMPTQYSSKSSLEDANELIEKFSIPAITVDISEYIETFNGINPFADNLRKGNFSARIRMATLYDISAERKSLVIGTSNKSELLLGYGTIFGDLASAINPIGDIYKSDLFDFAKYLGVPESIVSKPPSADLFEGQSDEKDLGATYSEIDTILKLYVEERFEIRKIINQVKNEKLVKSIIRKVKQNQFKRKMPIIAKIGSRTFGHDFLYPRDIKI